jgi:hypothetical protein
MKVCSCLFYQVTKQRNTPIQARNNINKKKDKIDLICFNYSLQYL